MPEMTSESDITYVCFVGSDHEAVLSPIWHYGTAIKRLFLLYTADFSSDATVIYGELKNSTEFRNTMVNLISYSRKETKIDSFKRRFEKRVPITEENREIIISVIGCSKPVFLSMILFANEHDASIILSAGASRFKIYEGGYVREQTIPMTIRSYFSRRRIHVYPKLPAKKDPQPSIPESVLKTVPEIYDYRMVSTITGKKVSVTVDFAAAAGEQLILGKLFTREGESYYSPCRIFADSVLHFGEDCRILIYAVGDDLYKQIREMTRKNRNVTVSNIPDPWCLSDYPEIFREDLESLIQPKK